MSHRQGVSRTFLTFRQKIIFSLMLMGLIPVSVFAAISVYQAYHVARQEMHNATAGMSHGMATGLESYFSIVHSQSRDMAANPAVVRAARDFIDAVKDFDPKSIGAASEALIARYKTQQEKTAGTTSGEERSWMPGNAKAFALQNLYIAANPNPLGSKQLLDKAEDGSAYSAAHARHHPLFRNFASEFGYYDVFIVDAASGDVVYSDFKEIDFMMNVKSGFLSNTQFAATVRKAIESGRSDTSVLSDFEAYLPSYNDPAAFVATPIVENGAIIAVLVFQLPIDKLAGYLANVVSLGQTSDAYITNSDGIMLTKPFRLANNMGDPIPEALKPLAVRAIQDRSEFDVAYTGTNGEALGSLTFVSVPSVSTKDKHDAGEPMPWVITIRKDKSEFMSGIYEEAFLALLILGISIVATSAIGWWLASVLTRPVQALAGHFNTSSQKVAQSTNEVGEAVSGMIAASEETSAQSVVVRRNSSEASGYVASVSTSIDELNISINDISKSISETNNVIDEAVAKAKLTNDVVRGLGAASKKITDVVGLINDLADQTNLLALNAAIEAARAGDAGRGFAVVADEVKKLASNTSEATVEIQEQIAGIQTVSDQSIQAIQDVVEAIHRIRDNATTVSAAVEEQSGVAKTIASNVRDAANRVQQVDENMNGIEQAANDTSVAANQVNGAANDVQGAFSEMKQQVDGVLDQMGIK